jgi:hypothetical protein
MARIERSDIRATCGAADPDFATAQSGPLGPHTLPKDNVDKSIMNSLHIRGSARVRFNGVG